MHLPTPLPLSPSHAKTYFFSVPGPFLFLFRPAAGPDHLVIALNPVECVSCIKNMELLFKNTNTFPVVFVFEEKYRKDSAGIIQSMALRDYHGTYVWSDSLFALSSMYGISAVSLVSGRGEVS